jgi:NitT/TauT family transport system substrate-binding protein
LQLAAGTSVAAWCGCSLQSDTPLRIAVQPWSGYQFLRLAAKEGWLPLDIELLATPTAVEAIRCVQEREADGAALTLDQALVIVDQGVPLDVVLITDISAGADVLLARPGITQLSDLRGKRIGAEATSLGILMTAKLLAAANLRPGDVTIVTMMEDHVQAWHEQRMDAVLTYEPARGQLQPLGLVPLFDSRSLPLAVVDVLVVRRDSARPHARQLRELVAGHFRSLHAWRTNPIDTAYRLAPLLQVQAERVHSALAGLDLPDEAYDRHALAGPSAELLSATADIADILRQAGTLKSPVATQEFFTAAYLPGSRP